jgi:hypothetical protein
MTKRLWFQKVKVLLKKNCLRTANQSVEAGEIKMEKRMDFFRPSSSHNEFIGGDSPHQARLMSACCDLGIFPRGIIALGNISENDGFPVRAYCFYGPNGEDMVEVVRERFLPESKVETRDYTFAVLPYDEFDSAMDSANPEKDAEEEKSDIKAILSLEGIMPHA